LRDFLPRTGLNFAINPMVSSRTRGSKRTSLWRPETADGNAAPRATDFG
jgi:hypothetical protein